jgi:FkbM family methyltransferase
LEPDPRNFEICRRNLEENEQITILQAGLGAESGYMSTEGAFWSVKTMKVDRGKASAANAVPVASLDEVLHQYDLRPPGILKMDIEGAETDVLNDRRASWPEKMEIILVETHGKESEAAVSAFAKHYCFSIRKHRSINILAKKGQ